MNSIKDYEIVKIHDFFLDDEIKGTVLSNMIILLKEDAIVPDGYKDCVISWSYQISGYSCENTRPYLLEQQDKINRYKRVLPKGSLVDAGIYDHYYSCVGKTMEDHVVVPEYMKIESQWDMDIMEYRPENSVLFGDPQLEGPFKLYINRLGEDGNFYYEFSFSKKPNTIEVLELQKSVTIGDDYRGYPIEELIKVLTE